MKEQESLLTCPAPFHNGRFVLESLIGRGGMAEVYRAYDQALGRWRAIKIMLPDYVRKRKLRSRFETEAKAMALLDHKNIVRVYDVGQHNHAPFIVMELCPGGSLESWVLSRGPFPASLAIDCVMQVCAGVQEAHNNGVIHRDIKSQNILVGLDGRCKITDFGIAQTEMSDFTNTGSAMGTIGFMAPEQRSDAKKVDVRSDVYSIGATLYNLITGKIPTHLFAADQDDEILAGIEPDLLAIIKRATDYKREVRYQTVTELRDALAELAATLPPALPGALTKLRGDYTPPPVPRVRAPTPQPSPRQSLPPIGIEPLSPSQARPELTTTQDEYVISVPPEHVRSKPDPQELVSEQGASGRPPIGAHQPPPRPAHLGRRDPNVSGPSNLGHTGPGTTYSGHDVERHSQPPHRSPSMAPNSLPEMREPQSARFEHSGYVESPSLKPDAHATEWQSNHQHRPTLSPAETPYTSRDSASGTGRDTSRGVLAEILDTITGPGLYLFIPLFAILLATVGLYGWSQSQLTAATQSYATATGTLVSGVERSSTIWQDLKTAGADASLIDSHKRDFDQATDPQQRALAARRLLSAARAEFSKLPTPDAGDIFAVREHRRLQQSLERLSQREGEWESADALLKQRRGGLFGG